MKKTDMSFKACQVARCYLTCMVLILCFSNCFLFPGKDGSSNKIAMDIAWRIPFENNSVPTPIFLDSGIIYIPSDNLKLVKAIDAYTGRVLWERKNILYPSSNIVKIGNYLYVFTDQFIYNGLKKIAAYKIALDGSHHSIIFLGDLSMAARMDQIGASGNYIYWPTREGGYARWDVNKTTIDAVTGTEHADCTILYRDSCDTSLIASPGLFYNGSIYIVQDTYNYDINTKIIKINELSGVVEAIWQLPFVVIDTNNMFPVIPYKDTFTLVGYRGACVINQINGGVIHSLTPPESIAGGSGNCVMYEDNIVYMTNEGWDNGYHNVMAYDMALGKKKWGTNASKYSLGSMPQVHNGILYVATSPKVVLLNSETGKILGYDDSIKGDNQQLNNSLKLNGLFIFQNRKEVIALKMNYSVDAFGNLIK